MLRYERYFFFHDFFLLYAIKMRVKSIQEVLRKKYIISVSYTSMQLSF